MPADNVSWSVGDWVSYVPTLTAASSNPTLGSGSVQDGRYVQIGNLVMGWAKINFGTSGAAAGSGSYRISLPILPRPVSGGVIVVGSGFLRDNSTTNKYQVNVMFDTPQQWVILRAPVQGGTSDVNDATPFVWAASDTLDIDFMYEAAT